MGPIHVFTDEFESRFSGVIIIQDDIRERLELKHRVLIEDLRDALGDPYKVVLRSRRKPPVQASCAKTQGAVYEISCETTSGRVLFVVSRLFEDGNLYIITAYWADERQRRFYCEQSEVMRNEE